MYRYTYKEGEFVCFINCNKFKRFPRINGEMVTRFYKLQEKSKTSEFLGILTTC